jgi:hypothetical protein
MYNVDVIKSRYPKGTRIECDNMNDPYSPIPSGTRGTIDMVDDVGTLFVEWDNGSYMGIIPGADAFHVV